MPDIDADEFNFRADAFALARTLARCPACGAQTPVFAVGLLPGHEMRDDDDPDGEGTAGTWSSAERPAFLFHIGALSESARAAIVGRTPTWRRGFDGGDEAWLNHCRCCHAVLGDTGLFCEPGGFCPASAADARRIELTVLTVGIAAAAAGYAQDPAFFDEIRRV